MQIIDIWSGTLEVSRNWEKLSRHKISYFSFLGFQIKFWAIREWDITLTLDSEFEIYVKWKLRWYKYNNGKKKI